MFYRPGRERHGLPRNPFNALVVPRPIGWISSLAPDGTANLAPYSFFNAVSYSPPQVMFSAGPRPHRKGEPYCSQGFQDQPRSDRRVRLQHGDLGPARRDEPHLGACAARRRRVRACRPDQGAGGDRRAAAGRRIADPSRMPLSPERAPQGVGGLRPQRGDFRRGDRHPYRRCGADRRLRRHGEGPPDRPPRLSRLLSR